MGSLHRHKWALGVGMGEHRLAAGRRQRVVVVVRLAVGRVHVQRPTIVDLVEVIVGPPLAVRRRIESGRVAGVAIVARGAGARPVRPADGVRIAGGRGDDVTLEV